LISFHTQLKTALERCSLECRKVTGFASLHDWLKKKSRHFFNQSENETKPKVTLRTRFPALRVSYTYLLEF